MGISVFDEELFRLAILTTKDVEKQREACKEIYQNQLKYARQRAERGFSDRDLWDISKWFLTLIPEMLEEFKKTRHGSPSCLGEEYMNEDGVWLNDTCHQEWDEILDKMIYLFRECREETCSRKNPFEEEDTKAFSKFPEKDGLFGEELDTTEEKKKNTETGCHTVHFMPEYQESGKGYLDYEKELIEYRERCRMEAMELFAKWLPYLWD